MAKQKYTDGGALEYFLGKLRERFADKTETKTSLELIQNESLNKSETRSVNGTLTPDAEGNIAITPEMVGALAVGDGFPVVSVEGETLILGLNNNTVNLINFTVNGEAYQAEESMTWAEWVESEYNTDGYYNENGSIMVSEQNSMPYQIANVTDTDKIEETSYNLLIVGGGFAGGGGN